MTNKKPHDQASFDAFLEEHGLLDSDAETLNERVFELLAAQGDELTQIREIDFFAYLPTPEARAQYIDKCLAAGFQLRATLEPNEHSDSYGVIVFHNDAPDEQTMKKIWELLTDFAEKCGGNFDGWETQVVG
jgi:regulator of ribonuclease activity B